jgi:hypothetical protein
LKCLTAPCNLPNPANPVKLKIPKFVRCDDRDCDCDGELIYGNAPTFREIEVPWWKWLLSHVVAPSRLKLPHVTDAWNEEFLGDHPNGH